MSEPSVIGDRTAVIWHEVECSSYTADLAVWEALAGEASGPVLDLGCGTGRVALRLARLGHEVIGIDRDGALIEELDRRAARLRLPVRGHVADVRGLELGRAFALVLAPMQLIELLPDEHARAQALGAVAAHLTPGGQAALALVGEVVEVPDSGPPLPDVLERDGWIYSSLPLPTSFAEGRVGVRRLRQVVSPRGVLSEEICEVELFPVAPETIESKAPAFGLRPSRRIEVPPTPDHVGSTVVVLEAA